jgi:hypothetical protein
MILNNIKAIFRVDLQKDATMPVMTFYTRKRRRVLSLCGENFMWVNLEVVYNKNDRELGTNSSFCHSKYDLVQSLDQFTETELMGYFDSCN